MSNKTTTTKRKPLFKLIGKFRRNGKFSRHVDHPKLNKENISHLNRSITSNEIEAAIKILPNKESPGPQEFTAEF
jgi:hypothetical protein